MDHEAVKTKAGLLNKRDSTLSCDMTAINKMERERHGEIAGSLLLAVQEIQELPDGYAFRLPVESSAVTMAAEFISRERLCCPFLGFACSQTRAGTHLGANHRSLGVKQFLKAEFTMGEAMKQFR